MGHSQFAGIFVLAPFNGYILDRLGYGIVLIVINTLSLVAVILQVLPVLQLQVGVTLDCHQRLRTRQLVMSHNFDLFQSCYTVSQHCEDWSRVLLTDCALLQVVMFVAWAASRYLLYSSFFTIAGSIFSYQKFGRIVGLISVTAGLLGLLQLPLTRLGIDTLQRNFFPLQIAAAIMVSLLYIPAVLMYRWERLTV
jgi:hypothetical protein